VVGWGRKKEKGIMFNTFHAYHGAVPVLKLPENGIKKFKDLGERNADVIKMLQYANARNSVDVRIQAIFEKAPPSK